MKYLIQVVEQSLPTAIVLAALSALLYLIGNGRRWPFWGFAAGGGAALVLAILRNGTKLINREYFNIATLAVALVLEVVLFILICGRAGRAGRAGGGSGADDSDPGVASAGDSGQAAVAASPAKLQRRYEIMFTALGGVLLFYCLPDIFLYPTDFVMAGESAFSTDFLYKALGFIFGALIVFLTALALYRSGTRLPYGTVRVVAMAAVAVGMVSQIAGIAQPLLARRIIPMEKWIFESVVFVTNHSDVLLYIVMAAAAVMPVIVWRRSLRAGVTGEFPNPAERRKSLASARTRRRWCALAAAGYVLAITSLTGFKAYDEQEVVLSPAEPMEIVGEEIVIPLDDVNDGGLHRFAYDTPSGIEVRFIVVKKSETAFGVGLDACDICGATGYYERKGDVICRLCDVVMNKSTIGFSGGCNPVPLAYVVREGNMIIRIPDLEGEESRFV